MILCRYYFFILCLYSEFSSSQNENRALHHQLFISLYSVNSHLLIIHFWMKIFTHRCVLCYLWDLSSSPVSPLFLILPLLLSFTWRENDCMISFLFSSCFAILSSSFFHSFSFVSLLSHFLHTLHSLALFPFRHSYLHSQLMDLWIQARRKEKYENERP